MRCRLLLMCGLIFAGTVRGALAEDVRPQILQNVAEIASPGIPGPLVLTSSNAVPIVCGQANDGVFEPVVAAVYWGKARAVVLGHPGYFGAEALHTADTGKMLLNAIPWLSVGKENAVVGVYRQPELLAFLQQQGVRTECLDGEGWLKRLNRVQVLCCSPASLRKEYIARGSRFEEWKSDPFLALTMYIQVIEEFGWEPVKQVIAEYRQLSPEERPRTDAQKRDQWMIRLSRAVGKNLAPFFDLWGVPVSQEAHEAVKHLPAWMPRELQQ